jgi:hypothetical protein
MSTKYYLNTLDHKYQQLKSLIKAYQSKINCNFTEITKLKKQKLLLKEKINQLSRQNELSEI